jgi:hypothetical protein
VLRVSYLPSPTPTPTAPSPPREEEDAFGVPHFRGWFLSQVCGVQYLFSISKAGEMADCYCCAVGAIAVVDVDRSICICL